MIRAWKRLVALVVDLLRQGISPRQVALTLVLGLTLSVFPIVGMPTLLCTAAALMLRLNLPLIQAVNYAGTPLQWLLIVPFLRLGERLVGAEPLPVTPQQVRAAIESQGLAFFGDFLHSALHAALGWLVVCPILIALVWAGSRFFLKTRRRCLAPEATPVCPGS